MPVVETSGVKIAFDVHGEGPPYVLICGTGQPAAMWHAFGTVKGLVDLGYQVVTFDNRGIPPSDEPPPPYTVQEMAEDTIGLLEHLGLGQYVLQGSSLGGLITQSVALKRPDLVRAVIFHVGCGNFSAYGKAQTGAMLDLMALGDRTPASLMTALSLPSFVPPTRWGDDAYITSAVALSGQLLGSVTPGLIGQMHADVTWGTEDHVEELVNLEMPALAIAAEFDTGFPPDVVKEAVARMPRGEFVEIVGSAHVSLDPVHAEQLRTAIGDFLARHAPAR